MNFSIARIADAADIAIPEQPKKHFMHERLKHHREMLMVGCCWEMAHIKPSYNELEMVIGCSHSVAMRYLECWRQLPWQERYAWLRLVEGRLARETNTVDAAVL